jgi:signal transduction histidine kinase
MNIKKYFPMNSAGVMDMTFDIYKRSFWMQIFLSIIINTISGVVMGILVFGGVFAGVVAAMSQSTALMVAVFVVVGIISLVFGLVVSAALGAGCLCLGKQAFYGERVDISRALTDTMKAVTRVATVMLAEALVMVPLTLLLLSPFIVALTMSVVNGYYLDLSNAALAGVVVYSVLAVLVVGLAANFFILSVPIALFEKSYFFKPLARSVKLLKNDFWKTFGVRLIFGVVIYVISYALVSVVSLGVEYTGILSEFTGSASDVLQLYSALGWQYAVSALISTVLQPLSGILTAVIYFNQRIKKEGMDIEIGLEILERERLEAERREKLRLAREYREAQRAEAELNAELTRRDANV